MARLQSGAARLPSLPVKPDPAPAAADAAPDSDPEVARLRAENDALKAQVAALRALADRDVLTPLLNRRAFMAELNRALAYCRRYKAKAVLIYLDLDGFKGVNDRLGHLAGDAALQRVADQLVASVRESDVVARLGGDEFAILLHQTTLDAARAKAAVLSDLIAAEPIEAEGERLHFSGSFGLRAFEGQDSAEQWLAEADAAMFVRKRSR